ncbi:hypothetical protein ACIQW5_25925 [Methylorubrum thiocyanatum]|uniref:hypothetical protein n=1 Tax=Methylorubrum TaxID=2282523 RepID=UPI000DB83FC1|nr:hypothetical protein [Methylorubrum populi]PZP68391.1 MAG: hypothetical protein DI590_16720 [Methylorubrum populi]
MKARRTRAEAAVLREAVLDAWAAGGRLAAIAATLGVTVSTVAREVREGRRRRDPRAGFRYRCAASRQASAPAARLLVAPKPRPALKAPSRREVILNAWAAGQEAPEIAAALGMRWRSVTMVVIRARRRGDPRAHRRQHDPADGLPRWSRQALERAARRYGVTVIYPEDRPC